MPANIDLVPMIKVGTLLRNAISASLPIGPEEYLTVPVAGTTIDLADHDKGGSFVYDDSEHAIPPTIVRQSEASLVDCRMPIGNAMVGNPNSVALSYSRALDSLIPAKATDLTLATLCGGDSPRKKGFGTTMDLLKKEVEGTSMTVVEVYRQKELAWERESSAWEAAKVKSVEQAEKLYPPATKDYVAKQKQCIEEWNKENYHAYKARIQAAYMDWVVNGFKFDVENTFGMIDADSIMARIEASKESMRNSAIHDTNSNKDVYGVGLSPKKWATYCKYKTEGSELGNAGQWTEIGFSYSPSDIQTIPTWAMEAGKSVGYGLWSIGGATLHDERLKEIQGEIATCNVSISFSALVVEINRPWLHGEIFSDTNLSVVEGVKISPGPLRVHEMIKNGEVDESSQFPAYPTSFIIAANTTIEFAGQTKAMEEFWRSGVEKVGYGPWSAQAGESLRVESTETGCNITFGLPQIIGWVSQIVPALPRS